MNFCSYELITVSQVLRSSSVGVVSTHSQSRWNLRTLVVNLDGQLVVARETAASRERCRSRYTDEGILSCMRSTSVDLLRNPPSGAVFYGTRGRAWGRGYPRAIIRPIHDQKRRHGPSKQVRHDGPSSPRRSSNLQVRHGALRRTKREGRLLAGPTERHRDVHSEGRNQDLRIISRR